MGIRLSVSMPSLREILKEEEHRIAAALTSAVAEIAEDMKNRLRLQVTAAGLGKELGDTWRARTNPNRAGRVSLHPQGFVWSKSPNIITFFDMGKDVVPINGSKYLAIPTAIALREGAGRKGRRRTPREVISDLEKDKGQKLIIFRSKKGTLLGAFNNNRYKSGAKKGQRRPKPNVQIYFVFVPRVKGRKLLDVNRTIDASLAELPGLIASNLAQ